MELTILRKHRTSVLTKDMVLHQNLGAERSSRKRPLGNLTSGHCPWLQRKLLGVLVKLKTATSNGNNIFRSWNWADECQHEGWISSHAPFISICTRVSDGGRGAKAQGGLMKGPVRLKASQPGLAQVYDAWSHPQLKVNSTSLFSGSPTLKCLRVSYRSFL